MKKNVATERLKQHDGLQSYDTICVIGLGYVGLPLVVELAKQFTVIGFDINTKKIADLQRFVDTTQEVSEEALKQCQATLSANALDIANASVKIVTVPTPIDASKNPDLTLLKEATDMVAHYVKPGDIIVYESTVYPGVTEEICAPIIEARSGLRYNDGFFLGYSPERMSPGDRQHQLTNIVKVVSGSTPAVCDRLAAIYGKIIPAGIYKAPSIKVAEAAKVIENTQRDLNVALMNELAIIFNKLGINTLDVIEAAATKWNFMKMTPGLVGGHCIGVDPYYLTFKAKELGYHPEVILAGRRINDSMGRYIASEMIKLLAKARIPISCARIGVFGITFKENVCDIRNTKVVDMVRELQDYGITPLIHDPHANPDELNETYQLSLTDLTAMTDLDGIIIAVPHRDYHRLTVTDLIHRIKQDTPVIFDIKHMLSIDTMPSHVVYKAL